MKTKKRKQKMVEELDSKPKREVVDKSILSLAKKKRITLEDLIEDYED
jgi:hypothetical protein